MRRAPEESEAIARRLGAAVWVGEGEAERLPALPGAYVLVLRLAEPVVVDLARQGAGRLLAGLYLYCGSARGPGGLRARIGRHLRADKRRRWHIDRLSGIATEIAAAAFLEHGECALAAALQAEFGAFVPMPGFGSSDCRHCVAHLLAMADGAGSGPA
ncbi:GIY-YIG nuclease family protein [Polymorphum gilvum]|uniref:Possible endonuclease III n=1 Tax=Polymorphum gilvum (strain LMG 25793 / CGMCC 1.9160 / SL003B-26A1) TaxID=991905 RepID=F2J2B9_POLGS|nr:GIY-YIG nuclease family protein [Polymorphum gilvum]ADZ69815.1 Possible endonuclease III [Polymorphum gilvum SL003B-26A1]